MRKWIRRKNWTLARDFYLNELHSKSEDGLRLQRCILSENRWLDLEVTELEQLAVYRTWLKDEESLKQDFEFNSLNNVRFSSWDFQLKGFVRLATEVRSLGFGHQHHMGHKQTYRLYISCLDTEERLGPRDDPMHPDDPDDFLELTVKVTQYGGEDFHLNISKKRWLDLWSHIQVNEHYTKMTMQGFFKNVYRGSDKTGSRFMVIFPDSTDPEGEDGETVDIPQEYSCSADACSIVTSRELIRENTIQVLTSPTTQNHLSVLRNAAILTAAFTGWLSLVKLFEILIQ